MVGKSSKDEWIWKISGQWYDEGGRLIEKVVDSMWWVFSDDLWLITNDLCMGFNSRFFLVQMVVEKNEMTIENKCYQPWMLVDGWLTFPFLFFLKLEGKKRKGRWLRKVKKQDFSSNTKLTQRKFNVQIFHRFLKIS